MATRMRKAEFTLEDFLEQLNQMKKMGPLEDILKMLPGVPRRRWSRRSRTRRSSNDSRRSCSA
jgi:signal recognition particle GTPase